MLKIDFFSKLTRHAFSKRRTRENCLKEKLRICTSQVVGSKFASTIVITFLTGWLVIMSGIKKKKFCFSFYVRIVCGIDRRVDCTGFHIIVCVCGEKVGEYRKTLASWNALYMVRVRDVLCAAFVWYEINSRPYALLLYTASGRTFFAWGARLELFFFCIPPVHGLVFNAIYGVARDGTLPEPPTPESHSSAGIRFRAEHNAALWGAVLGSKTSVFHLAAEPFFRKT